MVVAVRFVCTGGACEALEVNSFLASRKESFWPKGKGSKDEAGFASEVLEGWEERTREVVQGDWKTNDNCALPQGEPQGKDVKEVVDMVVFVANAGAGP